MAKIVDFNMIVMINSILKEKGYDYTVHSVGACTFEGLELRCNSTCVDVEDVVDIINEYLSTKAMKANSRKDDPYFLDIT